MDIKILQQDSFDIEQTLQEVEQRKSRLEEGKRMYAQENPENVLKVEGIQRSPFDKNREGVFLITPELEFFIYQFHLAIQELGENIFCDSGSEITQGTLAKLEETSVRKLLEKERKGKRRGKEKKGIERFVSNPFKNTALRVLPENGKPEGFSKTVDFRNSIVFEEIGKDSRKLIFDIAGLPKIVVTEAKLKDIL